MDYHINKERGDGGCSSDIRMTSTEWETASNSPKNVNDTDTNDSQDMENSGERKSDDKNKYKNCDMRSNGRSYYILDEVGNSEDEDILEEDSDISESEVHDLLERGYKENSPVKRAKMNGQDGDSEQNEDFTKRMKTVLVEKSPNHFEVLPDGWITVSHSSGMPLYLHRTTRVCTLSKPYFIGEGSCRNHKIPLSAVPCLDYRRALETEKNEPLDHVVNGTTLPHAKVVTAEESDETRQLTAEQLKDYCDKLFQFKDIEVLRFSSWPARRNYHKKRKTLQRPLLPEGSKLITCPIKKTGSKTSSRGPTEWIMNPNGKTYVCILHDYVQRALKEKPVYEFKEIENTATPYLVTISINGVEYGKGIGSSKKLAKMEAAKTTLEILIPGIKEKIEEDPKMSGRAREYKPNTDLSLFDDIKIEDSRVAEFCSKTSEPLPHSILLTCLQRNFGFNESNIRYEMKAVKHAKNTYTISVGNYTATVDCLSKRDGKQKAAQALLQILHPHVPSWGSLLRLYGNSSVKSFKEKKVEEQEITALQNKGVARGPNLAILNKLKEEMVKLSVPHGQRKKRPIGVFVPYEDVPAPDNSSSPINEFTDGN